MRKRITGSLLLAALAVAIIGCESSTVVSSADPAATGSSRSSMPAMRHEASAVNQLVAVMYPTEGYTARGAVTFTQTPDGIHVVADIQGLAPGKHGFHIHQYGDARAADGTSAGGHYNPEGHAHALPNGHPRHAGDLGNITADYNGNAHYEITVNNITLDGGHDAIVGRGLIIHAKPDDGGQPTGNAGPRAAIGVIGIAKP